MRVLKGVLAFLLAVSGFCVAAQQSAPLPLTCRRVVIAIAPSWNSHKARLVGLRRSGGGGSSWRLEFGPIPVLLGKRGLAWGIGIAGQGQMGLQKQERDWRAPAGIFKIGKLYTYDQNLPPGIKYPFYTMTARDVWISNPISPDYNRHRTVNLASPPSWYRQERMRLGDAAHRYMLEIRHNAEAPVPGAGSAIFFHIRRGVNIPTSGCTVLAQEDLLKLLRWLRVKDSPCYVLLPWKVYEERWNDWKLPAPAFIAHFTGISL